MSGQIIRLLEQGYAAQEQGNLDAARTKYLEVLRRDKDNEFALNLMGVVCIRASRYEEAVRYLRNALMVNAADSETHNNLGLALKELHRFEEAREAFTDSLLLNPERPAVLNNLGNVFASIDKHEEAIQRFESALLIDPDYVDCLNNLAASLKEVGRLEDALNVVDRAIRVDPGRSTSYNTRGEILLGAARYEEAREALGQAVGLDGNMDSRINMSTALKQLGKEKAAAQILRGVIEDDENNAEAHHHLGVLLEQMGDSDRAAEQFRLALKHAANHASSYYQLSKLKSHRLTQAEIQKVESLLDDPKLLAIFRSSLLFAMACEHEKRGEYETSMQFLIEAQAIKAARYPYDPGIVAAYYRKVREIFPVRIESAERNSDDSPVPIFVVGMPRSGTTLTEQIIASHSDITGAGEVGFVNDLVRQASEFTRTPYPESIARLTAEQAGRLRRQYLARMKQRFGNCRFVVDKNPLNFNFIGVIATVFPEARIVYCKRGALDNCVSIFRLPFDDSQGYSHDLAALGHYYRMHLAIMDFWRNCYSGQILTVQYEETVEHLEQQARRMLTFIGVDFEERVMSFFESDRIVMTPSAEQVRQPIYKSSVGSWKKYGPALRPLIDALEREITSA